ncbi:MAG: hypothetical protein EZS28_038608, partial [Streblomastix strix]
MLPSVACRYPNSDPLSESRFDIIDPRDVLIMDCNVGQHCCLRESNPLT